MFENFVKGFALLCKCPRTVLAHAYAVAKLFAGIWAGNAAQIGYRATFPDIFIGAGLTATPRRVNCCGGFTIV